MASIKWSTWIFNVIRSAVPIMRILAFFNLVSIEFHKVSVTCGIPDRDNPAENIFLEIFKKG